jgi:hypothetical protein
MKTKLQFRTVAEVVGVLSVLVSVGFLAVQVRQANQQARVQLVHDIQASYNGWHEILTTEPGAADLFTSTLPDSAFTPGQLRQRRSHASYLFNVWVTVHTAWENGLLSEDQYEGYAGDARIFATHPVVGPVVTELMGRYPGASDYPIFAPFKDGG